LQKTFLAAAILALGILLFFVFVLPQYDQSKMSKEALAIRRSMLDEGRLGLQRVNELNEQITTRQGDIKKIHSFLPERKQIDEIISSLKDISENSGLQLSGMTTSELPSFGETGYQRMLINADLLGQYPAFVNFLKLLEQSLRLYDVTEITAAASTTAIGNINFAIKINAYYLK